MSSYQLIFHLLILILFLSELCMYGKKKWPECDCYSIEALHNPTHFILIILEVICLKVDLDDAFEAL